MAYHAQTEDPSGAPMSPMGDRHADQRQGDGVERGDRILPKRLIIALCPNFGSWHLLNPNRPDKKDKNWNIGHNAA